LGWALLEASVVKAENSQPSRSALSAATRVKRAPVVEVLFCAGCAREVTGGAVIVRGTRYCSLVCGLAATIPGHYIG
jgi:hypothetical protein